MTPDRITRFRELMATGHVPDDPASEHRVYHRGWNGAIEFIGGLINKTFGNGENIAATPEQIREWLRAGEPREWQVTERRQFLIGWRDALEFIEGLVTKVFERAA